MEVSAMPSLLFCPAVSKYSTSWLKFLVGFSFNVTLLIFSFFLVVLGFELRALRLSRQAPYHLSHASSPFWSGYFEDRVFLFFLDQTGPWSFYVTLPAFAGMTGTQHLAQPLVKMGSHKLSWPVWPQTPISASQVARITGVSHLCLAYNCIKQSLYNLKSWKLNPLHLFFSFLFFFLVLGLELRAFTLSYSTSPIFVKGFLR
jgi:hypothetical protein